MARFFLKMGGVMCILASLFLLVFIVHVGDSVPVTLAALHGNEWADYFGRQGHIAPMPWHSSFDDWQNVVLSANYLPRAAFHLPAVGGLGIGLALLGISRDKVEIAPDPLVADGSPTADSSPKSKPFTDRDRLHLHRAQTSASKTRNQKLDYPRLGPKHTAILVGN